MSLQPVQDHVIGDGNALKVCRPVKFFRIFLPAKGRKAEAINNADYVIKSFPIRDVKGYFHVNDVDTRVIALKPIVIEMISDNCTMTAIFDGTKWMETANYLKYASIFS